MARKTNKPVDSGVIAAETLEDFENTNPETKSTDNAELTTEDTPDPEVVESRPEESEGGHPEAESSQAAVPEVEPDLEPNVEPENPVAKEEQEEGTASNENDLSVQGDLGEPTPEDAEEDYSLPSKPKRISLWSRLKNWIRRKRKAVAVPETDFVPSQEDHAIEIEALSPKELEAELKMLEAQIAASREKSEQYQTEIGDVQAEQERLDLWLESLKRSYFWKLELRMQTNLDEAKADVVHFEEVVKSLELPEKGQLRVLRQQFHKGLIRTLVAFSMPVAILFLVPWFSRVDLGQNITSVFRSPLYFIGVITLVAVVIGLTSLLRRVLGKKVMPRRKTVFWAFLAGAIPAALFALYFFQQWILRFVTPILEWARPTTLWTLGILFLFAVVTILIIYYQGWSVFRKTVNDQLTQLSNVAVGYVKTKQEIARLESLYSQTQRWMALLAHSLYRPWKIHPDWKHQNVATATSESFPLALRVAQALETDPAEVAQLRRSIAHSLLVQGWRSSAFERTLSQIGRYLGYEADKVTPSLLDEDLPHQPNNSQKLVLSFFEHSGATAAQGILDLGKRDQPEGQVSNQPTPNDSYLVEVARGFLSELAESAQESGLSQSRPSVEHVVKDPLADIRDSDEIASSDEVFEWDEFLADSLSITDQMQPPMGVLAFTDSGRKSRSAEVPVTKVLVPERFAGSIPPPKSSSVEIVAVSTTGKNSPAEVMVRLDLVGPLPFDHVALIQNSAARRQSFASDEENHDL